MRYSVITFGCRVNQADSLGFEEELLASGAESTAPESADLVIVNTCSVTATADQGARQTIRRVARDNPSARIVVTGCYATRRPGELAALPNVAQVVCNDDKPRLIPLLRRSEGTAETAETAKKDLSAVFAIPAVASDRYLLPKSSDCDAGAFLPRVDFRAAGFFAAAFFGADVSPGRAARARGFRGLARPSSSAVVSRI